jgi:hypothetical protein
MNQIIILSISVAYFEMYHVACTEMFENNFFLYMIAHVNTFCYPSFSVAEPNKL